MPYISNGSTIVPVLINEYRSRSEHGNIVHRILGSEAVDVVLRPATLRAGTMSLLIEGDTESAEAEAALRTASVWFLSEARETVDMIFVVDGTVTRELDATRKVWLIEFGWQEVGA